MTPVWQCRAFRDLTVEDLYAIVAAREEVFVVEQQCPFRDADGLDPHAWHLWGSLDGELAAFARLLPPGVKYTEPSIGRVLTTRAARGRGLGRALMKEALDRTAELFPGLPIRIGAQLYLREFYESFGFETASDVYEDDRIPHIEMLRCCK